VKILLIYPYFLEDRVHAEEVRAVPIGLYYIGALLKENRYDVEILNWHDINKTPRKIEETLKEKKPDVIGFSILHANRWGAIDIAQIAKRLLPEVKIVCGGVGATFLWKHLLTHFKEIDFAVLGEGEYSFLNLVKCIEKKNYKGINEIKGIAFREGRKILKTGDAEVIQDLDLLRISAALGAQGKIPLHGILRGANREPISKGDHLLLCLGRYFHYEKRSCDPDL
jgi:anaerobic magnesium-protoporphyrin IX monomethyl ester cyclase